jgi:membrane peptidoglycan carboxypeptidase
VKKIFHRHDKTGTSDDENDAWFVGFTNAGAKSQPETGNNDPAKSGTEAASAHAANESEAAPATKPKPTPSKSSKALAQFKVACDHWLPLLNERDQDQASTHANSMFEQLRNSRGSPGEAA